MDDKLRLDGNAAAGTLGEVFSFEVTTAHYACESCGRVDQIGAATGWPTRASARPTGRSRRSGPTRGS